MEGKPSLTTEINPLQIRNTFKDIPYYRNKSFTIKDIIQGSPLPYYRNKTLTI